VCGGRGYKGRVGIFEAIFMDSSIEEMLRNKPSEREIAQAAKPQGIPTMQQDGVLKILKGITSLDELTRVIDLEAR
jgi:type II secretory ATPase GspE/PulE/Tfp pilus assembly ATPase PilB-like protein